MTKAAQIEKQKSKLIGVFPFEFDEGAAAIPDTIHLIPIGQWEHNLYGPIIITANDIAEYALHFDMKVRKGVFVTAGHEGFEELPAQGWITKVEAREDGLWGFVEWTELGKSTLSDKQYKYFSPELFPMYEDPESHEIYRNVLIGGALTKSPYFKELNAIIFSEPKLKQFNETMDLQALLAKNIADLSDEEKAFIKTKEADLTDEQKVSHADILKAEAAPAAEETPEAKAAREQSEKEAANVAAGLNPDGTPKEPAPAAEALNDKKALGMVQISASELAILREKADKGAEAFSELEKTKLETAVKALTFSNSNRAGSFLPKDADKLRTFMEKLTDAQRQAFSALVALMPKTQIFSEVGASAAATEGTARAEVDAKVEAKITASGGKMKYSDALKEVMAENEGLEARYDSELQPIRGASAA